MLASKGVILVLCAALAGPCLAEGDSNDGSVVFDQGMKYDAEHGDKYKLKEDDKTPKKKDNKIVRAIAMHIKNLKDSDPEVRQTSAEMLGILNAAIAVPDLIDCLNPTRHERIGLLLAAHGALVKITGKNFGYKAYNEWQSWWLKNKEEFLKKAENGVDEMAKLGAQAANTAGLGLLHRGEYRAAQQQFLDAINRDPEVPDYRNNCGLSLLEQGRYLDAMEYFEETIGLNPDLPQPYMNIGRAYSRMNKTIEAQAWYKKAMERDKDGKIWDNFWMVGKEYMRRSEWRLAYEYLDQARVKAEKQRIMDPRLYNDLAITHFGLDEYHSAWKELMNVRQLGYEPNPGFVAKVKKVLKDMGIDPEAEDKEAREARQPLPDEDAPPADAPQKK